MNHTGTIDRFNYETIDARVTMYTISRVSNNRVYLFLPTHVIVYTIYYAFACFLGFSIEINLTIHLRER